MTFQDQTVSRCNLVISDTSGIFLLTNNSGTLSASTTILSGSATFAHLGDFDLDGDLDIITAASGGGLRVSLNNGSGSFTTSATIAGREFNHLAIADINGDQIADVVGTSPTAGQGFSVFFGTGTGSF